MYIIVSKIPTVLSRMCSESRQEILTYEEKDVLRKKKKKKKKKNV